MLRHQKALARNSVTLPFWTALIWTLGNLRFLVISRLETVPQLELGGENRTLTRGGLPERQKRVLRASVTRPFPPAPIVHTDGLPLGYVGPLRATKRICARRR